MGTNYYLRRDICEHCGRHPKDLHIGKQSGGWAFALRVYTKDAWVVEDFDPQLGPIECLADWRRVLDSNKYLIFNEYGEQFSAEELLTKITVDGKGGRRHDIDGDHCIGRGDGPWDLLIGEFS